MLDDAKAVLQLMPAFKDKHENLVPLGGGLTNRIYKFDSAGQSYVLRVFGQGTDLLGIDRGRERACLRAAATVRVGADVIAHLSELGEPPFPGFCGALVVRFISGDLLNDEAVRNPDILCRVAETIKRFHSAPVDGKIGLFVVFNVVRRYIDQARERNVKLPAELGDALALLDRIQEEAAGREPLCLCHNDLLAGNFVDDGARIRVIDWEYGGRGDRFFDLGNFAANMELSDDQEKNLLQAYFGEVRPEHLRRVKLMRLASDLREATWSYLQSAISRLNEDYLGRGHKHLDRFLAAARAMDGS